MTGEVHWFPVAVVLLGLLAVGALWLLAGRGEAGEDSRWQQVACPASGTTFGVLAFRRSPTMAWNDVLSCSRFLVPTQVTCDKACLQTLNGHLVPLRSESRNQP